MCTDELLVVHMNVLFRFWELLSQPTNTENIFYPYDYIHLFFYLTFPDKLRHLAATRLQASWRGYLTRQKHPKVRKVRQEIRSRRAEDHIGYLRNELERYVGVGRSQAFFIVHIRTIMYIVLNTNEVCKDKNLKLNTCTLISQMYTFMYVWANLKLF